jgi:hypothetical protein
LSIIPHRIRLLSPNLPLMDDNQARSAILEEANIRHFPCSMHLNFARPLKLIA